MATKTPGDLLKDYGDSAETFRMAEEELNTAKESIKPAQDSYDSARATLAAAVEALGSDPFKILKGSGRGGARGPRGPRDPEKRQSVLNHMTGQTVAQIVDAVNAERGAGYVDKGYVNGVINSERNKGTVTAEGERGSKTYTWSAPAIEAPVEA